MFPSISTIEIQNLIESEENSVQSQFIQTVEQSQNSVKSAESSSNSEPQISSLSWSSYFKPPSTSWGVHSKKPKSQVDFENQIRKEVAQCSEINPFLESFPTGTKISSLEAASWNKNSRQNDIRPRLYDKGSNIHRLVDTGSEISTTTRLPSDKLNPSLTLQAVNHSPMKT